MIRTRESGILIGTKGANFAAVNHLLRKIVGSKSKEIPGPKFSVDINDYGKSLTETLKNKVTMLRERARSLKTNVTLEPMSSYERMIVHSLCQGFPDIRTESEGDGEERRVVIKYVESVSPSSELDEEIKGISI